MMLMFSSFDPMTKINQMNWMMMASLLPMNFWIKKSRMNLLKTLMEKKMTEMKNITHHKEILIMSM